MASRVYCSVKGCFNFGIRADGKGNLFCALHKPDDAVGPLCDNCDDIPKCSVDGCTENGIIVQAKTGTRYCVNHAWKQDRIAASPPQTEWDEADKIRLRGWGIKI